METLVRLTEAILAEMSREGWSVDFTAQRSYRPRFETADLSVLQVSVVPRSLTIDAASRAGDSIEYKIDVAVQQRLDEETVDVIDPLVSLTEEIARHFRLRRPSGMPTAVCVKVENDPVYAVEHLDQLRCFTSILTLTFRVMGEG